LIKEHKLSSLYQYMMNKEMYYYNDTVQLRNNVQYRTADPLDHLEMIMAQIRLETAKSVFQEIYLILREYR